MARKARFAPPPPLAQRFESESIDAPVIEDKLFESVPATMGRRGRVEGFESLRDLLLTNWQALSSAYGIPLHALLKLVLETDRHALFAMMAEEKLGDSMNTKNKAQRWFQDYLGGDVETSLHPETNMTELPGADSVDGEQRG